MSIKVLLVDDDVMFRTLTGRFLEKSGYTIESAEDGLVAWEKLESAAQFDLVLLDRQMPGLDGIALLAKIRADKRFGDLPVIMLTAADSEAEVAEGLAAGAYYYLTKPTTRSLLELVIKNVLEESRQRSKLREQLGRQANSLLLMQRAEFVFRTLDEAKDLAVTLAETSLNPERTFLGYFELLTNAVEHGNLGITYEEKSQLLLEDRWGEEVESRLGDPRYADRVVRVSLERCATDVSVTIVDQGAGFDWQSYIEFHPGRAFDLHGRGIAMTKMVSFDRLEYLGNGNAVRVTVALPGA